MMLRTTLALVVALLALILSSGCATFDRLQSIGALSIIDGQPQLNLLAVRQAHSTDCGVACLAGVLAYWGTPVSQKTIKHSLGKPPRGGYTLAQLLDYAQHKGFDAFVLEGSYDLLQHHCALDRPCIIVLKTRGNRNHSLVVVGVTEVEEDHILHAMDPSNGKLTTFRASDIDSRWAAKGWPVLLIGRKEGIE